MKHGYLIDMDGVLYRGHELIAGADAFIHELRARAIPFRLLTNNGEKALLDYQDKRVGRIVEQLSTLSDDDQDDLIRALNKLHGLLESKKGGTSIREGQLWSGRKLP